ncbi:DUF1906 domain-containing protein [Paenibacillus rigui]|uniref:Rv2525c-like glycoside hydrolase-like domain-containing protein n=1 Tax=Paenibacillus rigui TaxID=554312 RepID=A0A229UXK2_9BACL|nr:DUF1906 domain-containing protein [Paenibacillus rigui]OXM87855.1 hypothetical protein CF651_01725 [Paenibacillus rigui]
MAKGFDCATPLTAAAAKAFYADGYEFVARYLVPSGWKMLSKAEAELISKAGLQIVSVYETTADRALGGRAAGLSDGITAMQTARSIGQPEGSTIYFAVDFDATAAQMPAVIDYIRAASEITPGYNTGVYGSYSVVEAVSQAGACSRFWQTYAWSQGKQSSVMNIYQYQNDITVNGIGIDLNRSFGNEGWWNTLEYMLSPEDANKMIAFLGAGYMATEYADARAEFHRLANELRKASGQPET